MFSSADRTTAMLNGGKQGDYMDEVSNVTIDPTPAKMKKKSVIGVPEMVSANKLIRIPVGGFLTGLSPDFLLEVSLASLPRLRLKFWEDEKSDLWLFSFLFFLRGGERPGGRGRWGAFRGQRR